MIETDDAMYRVDKHYLGPTGKTLPFPVRYVSIGVGTVVFVIVFLVVRAIVHLPLTYPVLLGMVFVTMAATTKITKHVNADRTLSSVIKAAYNDLTAPRPPKAGKPVWIQAPTLSTPTFNSRSDGRHQNQGGRQ